MAMFLLLVIALSIGTVEAIYPEVIAHPPEIVVAFLNPVVNITVTCDIMGNSAYWNVNGTPLNSLPHNSDLDSRHVKQGKDLFNCTLDILAKAKYNGTIVQCVALTNVSSSESPNTTIFIQGRLDSVGNLSIHNSSDSIFLTWSPPFSLDVTDVDPDIWYTVLISNVTDEDNPVNVSCDNCTNIIWSQYNFTSDNPSPSHKYSFTVIPQNGVGEGSRSEPVVGAFVDGLQPSPTVTPTPTPTPTSSSAVVHFLSSVFIIFLGIVVFKLYIF